MVAVFAFACRGAQAGARAPGYVMCTGPNGQRKAPENSGCHPGQASGSEREPGARASVWAVALDPRLTAEGVDESGWLGEAAADNVCTRQPAPQALPPDAFGERPKGIGIQAGPAGQGAFDICLGQQLGGVGGLHR